MRRNENETKKRSGRACMLKGKGGKAEDEKSHNRQIDEVVKEKVTAEARKCQGGSGSPGIVPGGGEESKKVQGS